MSFKRYPTHHIAILISIAVIFGCASNSTTVVHNRLWFDTTKAVERTFTAEQKDTIATEIKNIVSVFGADQAAVAKIDSSDPFHSVRNLDPYSRVYDASDSYYTDYFQLQRFNDNPYGLILEQTAQGAKVVTIHRSRKVHIPLTSGVTILSIGGKSINEYSADDLALALYKASAAGTTIEVQYRSGLKRKMKLPKVEDFSPDFISAKMIDDSTGYIRFEEFSENIDDWIELAATSLKELGMKYLLLDLRGNTGGVVKYILEIQKMFVGYSSLDSMVIGKLDERQYWQHFHRESIFTDLPVLILVDRNTASAAEALAGAMQDRDRAVVVGEQTYGKGTTLAEYKLPYDLVLLLASGNIYLPSGRCNERPYSGSMRCDLRLNLEGTVDNFDHHAEANYINNYYQSPSFKSRNLKRQLYPTMGIIPDYIVAGKSDRDEDHYYSVELPKWLAYQYYSNILDDNQRDSLTYYIKADQFAKKYEPPQELMKQLFRVKDYYHLHGDVAAILKLEDKIKVGFIDALAHFLYNMEYYSDTQLLNDPVVKQALSRRSVAAMLVSNPISR
ncbi:MAG TPA: S41 family peptidase [Candidatus Kapabacteria bacterium]|nr:S41 family peptidase [Candidatus Kapabacteria bacterium]